MKLGEALIKNSIITRDQLKKALERQVIFGGRIGSNIIELGFVKEQEMLSFLSSFFKVPPVKVSDLGAIDPEVIASISSEIADKYKMLPFKKDRNRLHAAMLDPQSMSSIDELRFLIGIDVVPYVITELRLLYCLEKYYDLKRDLRYISVFGREDAQEEKKPEDAAKQVIKVKEQFGAVRDKEEVIGILLNETKPVASRAAVFLVKGNAVSGWKSRGVDIERFDLPADGQSVFSEVLSRKTYYRGPLLKIPGNALLIERLNGTPQDCCMMPVTIRDKIIGLLYVDNGNASVLDAGLGYIHSLVAMAAVSFEIVILRKKLFDL
ncbi:MAG: hypothetical protein Q8K68_08175 [Nitrospirota bacterium]|nr:hypothetical protein [Nitrospirota bacterium]